MFRVLSMTVTCLCHKRGVAYSPLASYLCEPIGVNFCEAPNFRCPRFFNSWRRHCFLIEVLTLVVGDDIHTGVVLFLFAER